MYRSFTATKGVALALKKLAGCTVDYSDLSAADLIRLCTAEDQLAWEEFVRRYQRPMALVILRVLRRWGELSTALLDDVLQETYVALCANDYRMLRQFVERHPDALGAMLRVVAANVTHDQIRARNAQKRGGDRDKAYPHFQSIEGLAPDDGARRIDREVQLDEIDRLLQRAPKPISSRRDREIFWLHFRAGMSAQAISELPFVQLTAKGVETSLYRTLEFIRKAFKITPD
jgi:RNA polymerase sigma-70 factor (ECF subfamily)